MAECDQLRCHSRPRGLMIWSSSSSEGTVLLKCLSSYLRGSGGISSEDGEPDIEMWFEPYSLCRYARAASQRVYGLDLPREYVGNERDFTQVSDGIFRLLRRLHSFQKADPYLLSYRGMQKSLEASDKFAIVKDVAEAMHSCHDCLPASFRHVFLIQDPISKSTVSKHRSATIDSLYLNDMQNLSPTQRAFCELFHMWQYVRSNSDCDPLIINFTDFASEPQPFMRRICELIGAKPRDDIDDDIEWQAALTTMETSRYGCVDIMALDAMVEGLAMKRALERAHNNSRQERPLSDADVKEVDSAGDVMDQCMAMYREIHEQRYIPSSE